MSVFSSKTLPKALMALLFVGSVTLTGCGIKGDLATPPPLWGDAKAETEQADEDSILNESPLDDEQDDLFEDEGIEGSPF